MDVDAGRSEHSLPSPRQLKKLLKVYSQKLRLNPDDLDLRIKLAEVLRLLGRANEAIAFYSSIAWAYGVAGNLGQAITLCKIILELNPSHSETQQMLAKLYASQRIREEKHSVPVVMVEGRWIADPKSEVSAAHAAGPSQPYATPGMSHVEVEDEQIKSQQPTDQDLAEADFDDDDEDDYHDDEFEEDELTSDERPPRKAPSHGDESDAAVARRRSAPTSFELPPYRAVKSLADELEPEEPADSSERRVAPTAPQTPDRRTMDENHKNKPTAPQPLASPRPLDPEPLPEPASGAQDWLASAPTKRAVPEDFTGPDRPVVVTTDAAGKLTIDPGAAAQQPPNMHTMKISSEDASRLREAKRRSDAKKKLSKPTAPMPAAAQARRVAESIAETPAPIMPRRPTPAPTPPDLPMIGDGSLDDHEPTQLEDGPGAPPAPDDVRVTPEQSAETVIGEAPPTPTPGLDTSQEFVEEEPTAIDDEEPEDHPAGVAAAEQQAEAEDPSGFVEEEPTAVDDQVELPTEEPPSPTVEQPPDKGDVSTVRLSAMEMMGRLSAMGANVDSQPVAKVANEAAAPMKDQPKKTPLKKHGTAPGFQSTGELVPPQAHDPLRFLRTTRRYASVEIPPEELRNEDTELRSLDPELVSSVMRMEAASAQPEPQRASKGYAAIRREVRQDGRRQEDRGDLGTAEVEAAVEDLRDTIRELPGELDSLDHAGGQPRTPFPLFSDLDTAAFLAMVEKLERREYEVGSLVFQEGDPGDSLFLVSAGTLQVLKLDEEGRQVELAKLGAGSFFGEFGLLTDRRRHASVRTLDDCELLELRRDVLAELVQQHPSISWTLRIFYQQRLMAMVLATSPLFQAVGAEDRREVLSRFTIRRILEGETIIAEGTPTNGFYVILVGEVSVSCVAEDGLEVPLGNLSEGDYFGEISLLTGSIPAATVKANQLTEVLTLNARDFYDLTTTHPEIWAEVQRKADHRQQETEARMANRHKAAGPIPLI